MGKRKRRKEREEKKEADRNTQKKFDEMIEVYRDAGLIQGKVVEETIYRSVDVLMQERKKNLLWLKKMC